MSSGLNTTREIASDLLSRDTVLVGQDTIHLLHDSKRARIADAAISDFAHLTAPFVPDELEQPIAAALSQGLQSGHHDTNGMPSTDCVTGVA